MNTSRYVYNKTVNVINDGARINFYDLRDVLVTKENKELRDQMFQEQEFLYIKIAYIYGESDKKIKEMVNNFNKKRKIECSNNIKDWELNTPKDIRAGAVKAVVDAYKTAFTNLRNGNMDHFTIDFKSKKKNKDTIVIPKYAIKMYGDMCFDIYPSIIKESFNVGRRSTIDEIKHDCKIQYTTGQYYLLIPVTHKKKDTPKTGRVVGGDLGSRTFLTTYNNTKIVEYNRDRTLLYKLQNKIDTLKRFRKSKQKITRVETRLANIIDDLHWKVANHLTTNYDVIFLGRLDSQKCVKNSKKHQLNRDMNMMKFYQFTCKLKYLTNKKNKLLMIVHEAYTSQTCPKCGLCTKVDVKDWKCRFCSFSMDRDILGARNILMKGIVSTDSIVGNQLLLGV